MKKLIIIAMTNLCALAAIGQINVSAKIEKLSRYDVDCIYTTITNNSSDVIYILDGGWFEPKDNGFYECSHLGAYFTGYSNEMKPIFERSNYPLSLPYGDRIPKIKIPAGKSYTTYTRLYGNHDFYGIINDQSIAPNIAYLSASVKMICFHLNGEFNYLTIQTNKINVKMPPQSGSITISNNSIFANMGGCILTSVGNKAELSLSLRRTDESLYGSLKLIGNVSVNMRPQVVKKFFYDMAVRTFTFYLYPDGNLYCEYSGVDYGLTRGTPIEFPLFTYELN